MNRTYLYEKDKIKKYLILMKSKLQSMYGYRYPVQRRVMEERLAFLEAEYNKFEYMINPYHVQPGILLDVDITSIKRKKATLDGMANVLNEFLHGVSKGFQDAAFASFSRRRSTVREDIDQRFATDTSEDADLASPKPAQAPAAPRSNAAAYLDILNSPTLEAGAAEESTVVNASRSRSAGRKPAGRSAGGRRGAVDKVGKKPGRPRSGGTVRL
jgi:hypothetical protein